MANFTVNTIVENDKCVYSSKYITFSQAFIDAAGLFASMSEEEQVLSPVTIEVNGVEVQRFSKIEVLV